LKITRFSGDFRFLSNFYPVLIFYEGHHYNSVEHAYQAAKTLSEIERQRVRHRSTPGEAKQLGKTLTLREGWEGMKLKVMEDLVRQKFINHPVLAAQLRDTADAELIEGNHWGDRFWGRYMGLGENHLGKILMKVRAEVMEKGAK